MSFPSELFVEVTWAVVGFAIWVASLCASWIISEKIVAWWNRNRKSELKVVEKKPE